MRSNTSSVKSWFCFAHINFTAILGEYFCDTWHFISKSATCHNTTLSKHLGRKKHMAHEIGWDVCPYLALLLLSILFSNRIFSKGPNINSFKLYSQIRIYIYILSIRVLRNWHASLETCPMSLIKRQIYHNGKFAFSFNNVEWDSYACSGWILQSLQAYLWVIGNCLCHWKLYVYTTILD